MDMLINYEVQSLDPKFDILGWFVFSCLLHIVLVSWLNQQQTLMATWMQHFTIANFDYVALGNPHAYTLQL